MVFPLIVALAYGEYHQAGAFLLSIAFCITPGIVVTKTYKHSIGEEKLAVRDSYFIVTASWILSSIAGALPYFFSGSINNILLAFFESASGFTTTGATIFSNVEILPHSILLWRSLTQWMGGMGMIVFFFAVMPKLGAKAGTISQAETPGPIQRKLTSKYTDTAKWFYIIYFSLTLILTILLIIGGMTGFDAINHALTTLATGGFSTKNDGISFYSNEFIYISIGLFALFAGTNFALFHDAIRGKFKSIIKDEEFRYYIAIILISSLLITISLKTTPQASNAVHDVTAAFFQVINTISTLGVETANSSWPPFCILILAFLMVMGGCSSSTAGGIKVSRVATFFKAVRIETKQRLHGNVVEDIKYNGRQLQRNTIDYIISFVVLYLAVILSATLLICLFGGGDLMTNMLSILSCISNLGPGLDNLGLLCQYHTESAICIIVYTMVMIAGRLELSTFLVIFSRHYWDTNRIY